MLILLSVFEGRLYFDLKNKGRAALGGGGRWPTAQCDLPLGSEENLRKSLEIMQGGGQMLILFSVFEGRLHFDRKNRGQAALASR